MKKILFISIFILTLFSTSSFSQSYKTTTDSTETKTIKILFIGNSYTYFNSLPHIVEEMAKAKFSNIKVETKMISQGGATLKRHWKKGKALEEIKKEKWDYVVLQEQSILGSGVIINSKSYFDQPDTFFEYAKNFNHEITKIGAKTVFFMTWAKKETPKQQKYLTYAYNKIAKELNSIIAPVGFAWHKNNSKWTFDLYVADGSHPSEHGSYLAASTLFGTIFSTSPLNISGKIDGYSLTNLGKKSKEIENLVNIAPKDAKNIQSAAWDAINFFKQEGGYLNFTKPKLEYTIPNLPSGQVINKEDIIGKWYGTTKYNSNTGVTLSVKHTNDTLKGNISFYKPDQIDTTKVKGIKIESQKSLFFTIKNNWGIESEVNFIFKNNQLIGLSKTKDQGYTFYDSWKFSKKKDKNSIDLDNHYQLITSLNNNIKELGYVNALTNHYKQYSKLVGSEYIPDEADLNRKGYASLSSKNIDKALNHFKLAIAFYPKSANTYDSLADALIALGQKEEALKMYTKACDVARKTNDKRLTFFEQNKNKLKKEIAIKKQKISTETH